MFNNLPEVLGEKIQSYEDIHTWQKVFLIVEGTPKLSHSVHKEYRVDNILFCDSVCRDEYNSFVIWNNELSKME
jgi:hypothetical protein